MLPLVKTPTQKLEKYKDLISKELFEEIKKISQDLKGLRVLHVNATPRGGGVAEVLKSLIPLMKGVGIEARWYTIPPREDFFEITKKMHNALQGQDYEFPFSARKRYLHHIESTARLMQDMTADIWVVHDPQPAGIIEFLPHFHPSICRLHVDLTSPNQEVWDFVAGFLESYDKVILTSKKYIKPEIKRKVVIFPPAIDPLAPKNQPLALVTSKQILKSFGINSSKPLISQVSRFDPWKDPLGVIEAYKIAKKKIPNLQLALVGFFLARDDPEAMKIYKIAKKKAEKDPNVFLFANRELLGSLKVHVFVKAIQASSDIILQKSTREGFGLCVLPNTEVLTEKGPNPIKNIIRGDKVLAEDGEFHEVKDKTFRTVNEYLEITTWKGTKVGVTKEHPFLSTSKSRKSKITEGDLRWRRADELFKGDFIAAPIPRSKEENILIDLSKYDKDVLSDDNYAYYKFGFSGKRKFSYKNISKKFNIKKGVIERAVKKLRENKTSRSKNQNRIIEELSKIGFVFPKVEKINRFIPLNPEIQWFIGWYIAEGDTNGKMVEINANSQEIDKVIKLQKIAKKYFGKEGTIDKRDTRLRLIISSQILSKFFSSFGKSAKSKHIPDEWLYLGKYLKWIALGILEGDGVFREGCGRLSTTSKKLAWQMWQILLADKIPSTISKSNNFRGFKSSNSLFEVRFGGREYYRFCKETVSKFSNNPSRVKKRMADHAIILDHFVLLPIRKIRKVNKNTKVYDISVEGTHSFVGNGYLLHNTVAEAMWKGKPVIGGDAEGIKLQIKDGENGFLVSNPQKVALRIVQLIKNPKLSKKLGQEAKKTVQKKFLMPRLLRDYLNLFKKTV